ncbi:uncharacterized protein G2W53_038378 [Senna tora]|uniref:Uncharacterized protein n=1 Tax=Senna tora TaxID=362788 RepID=A0A834SLX6_9FABA|nr:uncharacterized protein G2W53_038378 [Senna tora]
MYRIVIGGLELKERMARMAGWPEIDRRREGL